jgi:hypothetical protein
MFVLAGKVKEEEKSVNVLVHHPQTGSNALGIACQSRMMRTLHA